MFSDTEDTSLKRFLTGNKVYIMLAAAIFAFVIFVPTFVAILGIYSNVEQAQNVVSISDLNLASDLDGQYVSGNCYKFLAKLGYIAQTEAAATHYYYLMYIDSEEFGQVATLVKADKRGDADIAQVISAYLTYAKNQSAGYQGNVVEIEGRFPKMTSYEKDLFTQALSSISISGMALDYTLKVDELPKASNTVGYWFIAVPFGIAMVVCAILFVYGLILEDKRAKANQSPYPYLNRKKKRN